MIDRPEPYPDRPPVFSDREDAGRRLAAHLVELRAQRGGADHEREEPGGIVVVGLPRGGVPVAAPVAAALDAPLDVILVRKLGVPFQPELAMGAIGEGGVRVTMAEVIDRLELDEADLAAVEARERIELERRARRYRGEGAPIALAGREVIVVDDGVATGSTARAACLVARAQGARRVVLAVPVAPVDWVDRLADAADELVALATPDPFVAVGRFYLDFAPPAEDELVELLGRGGR